MARPNNKNAQPSKSRRHRSPKSSLDITSPQAPLVSAYGKNYDAYLIDYEKYVVKIKNIRKEYSVNLKDSPGRTYLDSKGVPVEILSSKVLTVEKNPITGYRDVVFEECRGTADTTVFIGQEPELEEMLDAMNEQGEIHRAGPQELKAKPRKPKAKVRKSNQKNDYASLKRASDTARLLFKTERAAGKIGRRLVKQPDGWTLVTKGPKPPKVPIIPPPTLEDPNHPRPLTSVNPDGSNNRWNSVLRVWERP